MTKQQIETTELTLSELETVCGARTNGDDPFVQAVMKAFNDTVLYGSVTTPFPGGTHTGSGGGGGRCAPNHNGV
jgi:hypothetical protein